MKQRNQHKEQRVERETETVTLAEEDTHHLEETLHTHLQIQRNHSYEILTLENGHARVRMQTKLSEQIDESAYIYEASLFSCANFCAVASVNEKDSHLISARIDFLDPVRVEDESVLFEATATTTSSGKKHIDVVGTVRGIVVFESSFVTIKLDNRSLLKED